MRTDDLRDRTANDEKCSTRRCRAHAEKLAFLRVGVGNAET